MRKLYLIAGLLAASAGMAGWATLGSAQPAPVVVPSPKGDRFADVPDVKPPVSLPGLKTPKAEPLPKPRADDPFADPLPPIKVTEPTADIKVPKAPIESPVKVLDPVSKDIKLPDLNMVDVKPPVKLMTEPKPPVIKETKTEEIKPIVPVTGIREEAQPLIVNGTGSSAQPSMAKQEPAVSLEWLGPTALKWAPRLSTR